MFGLVRGLLFAVGLVHVILAQQVSPPKPKRDPLYRHPRLTILEALRQRANMCCKQRHRTTPSHAVDM